MKSKFTTILLLALCATFGVAGQTQQKPFFDGAQDPKSKSTMIQAQEDIEKYRKGDFNIRFINAKTGKPIKGEVELTLTKHKFNFGASMYGVERMKDEQLRNKAKEAVRELFNTISVCDYFNKEQMGDAPMLATAKRDIDFGQQNDINLRFHAALFNLPKWIDNKNYSEEQCWAIIESRLEYVAKQYGDIIDEYDLINEFINELYYPGGQFFERNQNYPKFCEAEVAAKVIALARKYLPNQKLVVLETSIAATNNPIFQRIVQFHKDLTALGADYDYVGYQGHFYTSGRNYRDGDKRYGDNTYTMGRISEALDMLGQVGKPVVITEFNGPSRNSTWSEKTTEYCWDLSEEENAAWQENFYRLAFSKPYIQQLTRWFLIDELGGKGMDAGILTTNGARRAIYDKLNQLINVEWHTHHKAKLDAGQTTLRGFYGTYQIEVKGYKKSVVEMEEAGQYIVELEP